MRRFAKALSVLALVWPLSAAMAEPPTVYKSPTCACCTKWVDHMTANGISMTPVDMSTGQLNQLKASVGLKPEQASCHTAVIDGYVIEGHVPAADVKRLLTEKPEAIGLAVPRMPMGSPGMEMEGMNEPYDVLLIKKDGSTEVFARH